MNLEKVNSRNTFRVGMNVYTPTKRVGQQVIALAEIVDISNDKYKLLLVEDRASSHNMGNKHSTHNDIRYVDIDKLLIVSENISTFNQNFDELHEGSIVIVAHNNNFHPCKIIKRTEKRAVAKKDRDDVIFHINHKDKNFIIVK